MRFSRHLQKPVCEILSRLTNRRQAIEDHLGISVIIMTLYQ